MHLICGADLGNENIQLITSKREISIKNRCDLGRSIDTELMSYMGTYNVNFNGENYVVGNYAEHASTKMEGKNTQKHLMGFLVALSQIVQNNTSISLVLGESLNVYFNTEYKQNLRKRFLGEHTIVVNDKLYKFSIENVHILPESIGHKLLNFNKYIDNKVSYTIDIGSSTINYGYFEGLIPIESKSSAYPLGLHNLISNIRNSLAKNGGPINPTEQQIREYILNTSKSERINKIIDAEINRQLDTMELYLEGNGVKIHDLDEVEFCGGGSLTLERHIKSRYKNAVIVPDPLWSNARGFFKFAKQKFNG